MDAVLFKYLEYSISYTILIIKSTDQQVCGVFNQKAEDIQDQFSLNNSPLHRMRKHKGIANRAWFESQVRFGEWIEDRSKKGSFAIYATEFEGRKSITILIRIRKFSTHVLVCHAHVLGKKD